MAKRNSDPEFARKSFTWRRMKNWQVAVLVGAVGLFLLFATLRI
jgi:hypothetical protein